MIILQGENMVEPLLILIAVVLAAILILAVILLKRTPSDSSSLIQAYFAIFEKNQENMERSIREESSKNRQESAYLAKQNREEMSGTFKLFGDSLLGRMTETSTLQKNQLEVFSGQLLSLTQSNEQRLNQMRETVESRLRSLQEENSARLEQMRLIVDEKLHSTLEKRLGESFKLVSDRLEMVHKGLGEMQLLASSVGDLKKVLTNIKTRGTWGEIQLGALLEQVLTRDQYEQNVSTKKGSNERVEYAIRLPGRDEGDGIVWLPIDAKFPQEDYQRLIDAQEQANPDLAAEAGRQLENRIKLEAKTIREKYIDPPHTTDFAVLFLPTEGLYAEIVRNTGLCEFLQREFRVVIAGPTTLAALLNSLQMGFRTLAIERRSSEVWALLGAVKTEFGRFGDLLDKTQKKLLEASGTIESAAKKSRTIERKLRDVQALPSGDTVTLVGEGEEEST
ncbi:MAG TPA: DNA recombination protein RmuC [Syntrophales bacterium]|jgi:DNA recombination protein RmuC|nr:DNA recombination protein RmuC [Syntrophales bacterium]